MLINPQDSYLLVIDVQEKLVPKIHDSSKVIASIIRLVKSAQAIKIPVLVSEHCPEKIGSTLAQLNDFISADSIITKTHFSAFLEPNIAARLAGLNRKQVVIVGAETHVCVLQSALMLMQSDFQVFLVADGTSSRNPENKQLGISRMRQNSIQIVSAEMVIFEWLQRADTDLFRQLLPLIRDD